MEIKETNHHTFLQSKRINAKELDVICNSYLLLCMEVYFVRLTYLYSVTENIYIM